MISKKLFLVVITILLVTPLYCFTEEKKSERFMGLGIFVGGEWEDDHIWYISHKYDWKHVILHPTCGWKFNRAELYFEGNIGYLSFKPKDNVFSVGVVAMGSYDLLKYKQLSLFTELGGGFGYWNKSPSSKLVRHSSLGIIQYGTGLKVDLGKDTTLKLSARFTHTSAIPNGDTGLNSYGLLFGVIKYLK